MIQLACLDMAGTTLAVGDLVERAFAAGLSEGGIGPEHERRPALMDAVRREMGRSKIEVFREMLGDEATAQRANAAFELAVDAGLDDVLEVPGAGNAIDRLRAAGVKICLTTGFAAETREMLIDHVGWRDRIDLALSPGDGRRGRPAPDLVLAAVMALAIDDVRDVAAAGDTTNDLLAAHRAGCGVVAGVLTGAHDRETLAGAPHTHLLDSIADLPGAVR